MFLQELSPLFEELVQKPVAFMGGFTSGLLRLDLSQDPVKSWLQKQSGGATSSNPTDPPSSSNGSGPQSISID